LTKCQHSADEEFTGSVEIEFFSAKPLIYPFPAVSINFYGPHFSTVVHTAQRVYNDYDDMISTSRTVVPESGFNIYASEKREPFVALINGPIDVENSKLSLQFTNADNQQLEHEIILGNLAPYESRFIYLAQELDLPSFLDDRVGMVKLQFDVNWIFPRLIAGNIQHNPEALCITHSYYDCTNATDSSNYWLPEEKDHHAAALMLPLEIAETWYTRITFYPILSPCFLAFDIEIYDKDGKMLGSKQDAITFNSKKPEYIPFSMKLLCDALHIKPEPDLALRIIAKSLNQEAIPARIKVALDIGKSQEALPCNICTNLQPFNPDFETKKKAFRWAPVLADQKHSSVWIMNSSPAKQFTQKTALHLTFYREQDEKTIERTLHLPPHGFLVIRPQLDSELSDFFSGKIGWFTLKSDNPYITSYYFAEHTSGVIGGDHGY